MEIEQEYFRSFIEWYTEDVHGPGDGGQTVLAQEYGCSNQYINMIVKGKKKPSYKIQMKFINKMGYKREEALNIGKDKLNGVIHHWKKDVSIQSPTQKQAHLCDKCGKEIIDLQEERDKAHESIIQCFKDRETAREINKLLVELEERDHSQLKTVKNIINGLLAGAPAIEEKPKKTGTTDQPER